MTPENLRGIWDGLSTPTDAESLEAIESQVADVWLALDHSGRRHLLLLVPPGTQLATGDTHGLSVSVSRHRISGRGDAHYVDLSCTVDAVADRFEVVAADILRALSGAGPGERVHQLASVLSQWRWFWDVDPDGLSEGDALGLFGELWFLIQWAGAGPDAVRAWQGSEGSRHDFQWPQRSVEVKTTSKAGPSTHRISPLHQLEDPESGDLYLFSVRVSRDRLARNSLAGLVEAIGQRLASDPVTLELFHAKVAARGFSPTPSGRAHHGYRILGEELYAVAQDFPRLTQAGLGSLPDAVVDVSYVLDMTACSPWLVARSPAEWRPSDAVR